MAEDVTGAAVASLVAGAAVLFALSLVFPVAFLATLPVIFLLLGLVFKHSIVRSGISEQAQQSIENARKYRDSNLH